MCVGVPEKAIVFTIIGQAVVKLNIIAGGDLDQLVKSLPNIFQDHRSIYNPTREQICYLYIIASEIKRKSEKELMGVLCRRCCEVSAIAESLVTNEDCVDNLPLILFSMHILSFNMEKLFYKPDNRGIKACLKPQNTPRIYSSGTKSLDQQGHDL